MEKAKNLALILGVLIMSILLSYLVLAWTEPSGPPQLAMSQAQSMLALFNNGKKEDLELEQKLLT